MANIKDSKAIVLCFDGATFDLIKPWVEEGKLPTFNSVMKDGVSRVLESTIPPISATAWVTFLTGQNPGKHGVFEFRVIDPNTYLGLTDNIVNSDSICGKTFIDYVSANGLKVCSIAMPITYPPWKVNGMMVSGTPTPDNSKAYTYPSGLDFGIMTPYSHQKMSLTIEQKRLHGEYEANKRTQILCDAIKSVEYNLYLLHLHTADAAHHNYWRFFDPECPTYSSKDGYGKFMLESYQILDNQLKKVLDLVGDNIPIIIISDHGGCRRPRKQLHLNSWLKKKGFLTFKRATIKTAINSIIMKLYFKFKPYLPVHHLHRLSEKRPSIRKKYFSMKKNIAGINWFRTKTYAIELHHPVVGLEINLKGRQQYGSVETQEEYIYLIETLTRDLLGIRDPETNVEIIEKIVKKEDLYWGENLEKAPDLIIFLNKDYDISDENNSSLLSNTPHEKFIEKSGFHDLSGIFIAKGKPFKNGRFLQKANLLDIPATVLYLLGLPIPKDMDSKVLTDIFCDSFFELNEIRYGEPMRRYDISSHSISVSDEEEMKKQLKGLGYLD